MRISDWSSDVCSSDLDQCGVEGVHIFACYRSLRMANQCGDSDFGEAQVVSDTRKTVPQHVRRHVPELRVLEQLLPALREISDRVVAALAGKDVSAGSLRSLRLQILHIGSASCRKRLWHY